MSKKILIGISIVGILVIVGAAAYVLRPSAEASAPIEAIPVEVEEPVVDGPQDVPAQPAPGGILPYP